MNEPGQIPNGKLGSDFFEREIGLTQSLSTVFIDELEIPGDFPANAYASIRKLVSAREGNNPLYSHYVGAWNAIPYRFLAAAESGEEFARLVQKHGVGPERFYRYLQERAIFEFFSCGFSVLEASFYALYTMGALIQPMNFQISTEKDRRRVNLRRTEESFRTHFSSDPIVPLLSQILNDQGYKELCEVRNILTHQVVLGRHFSLSRSHAAQWELNGVRVDFGVSTFVKYRAELVRIMDVLMTGMDRFSAVYFV